jgi:DNA mismatch repair protein MutS
MNTLTPMMQQYLETKRTHPGCILFYRLGDFYEMFFEDAITASRELEITLTGKSCGLPERAPMCGVPFHAADTYINRLVKKGYKVAICEQMEDPKQAKGLVKRDVTRIVTPGTNVDINSLEESKNNYLLCIYYRPAPEKIGLAAADCSTGDFTLTECANLRKLPDELMKYEPSEILCNDTFLQSGVNPDDLLSGRQAAFQTLDAHMFTEENAYTLLTRHFRVKSLTGLGLTDFPGGTIAAGALLQYLYDTQKNSLEHFVHITPYTSERCMLLDCSSRRNLELTETLREKQKKGSLLWVLDKTRTAMGARMLRTYLEQPLLDAPAIEERLDAVEALGANSVSRDEIREYLHAIYDLERLLSRIAYRSAGPRDLKALQGSLQMLPPIKQVLQDFTVLPLQTIHDQIDPLEDITALIDKAIMDEPPLSMKEGGLVKDGYDEIVDRLRISKHDGKQWLAALEETDRDRTGIKNLKIKYNKVFGYYFEITNSYLNLVPEDYIRKQTLANAERYTTPKLKELEDTILNAEDKLINLEYEIFCTIRDAVSAALDRIQTTAKAIARLDVFASLSLVAERNHYVRPTLNQKGIIDIKDGRHPVVEQMTTHDLFIPNDTYLDKNKRSISIITGPNMAGKSTYMRQCALIVLMTQLGSFVPATSANIGIVDRIFTRVGASDDLASGQSTFMVEMNEVANILRNATADSLLILDEIGRGTSTFDGLSIAWAVVEHISNRKYLGAKTLFATHYHELTELEGRISNVNNYCIAVKETGDDIVFLRKIIKGGADKSYGIQVAKLVGVPEMVIDRAKEIAARLSDNDILKRIQELEIPPEPKSPSPSRTTKHSHPDEVDLNQLTFSNTVTDASIIKELTDLDTNNLTPNEALNILYRLQSKIKNRWKM